MSYPPEKNGAAGRDSPDNAPERLHKMSAGEYFATRLTTLKPPMHSVPNPIKLLGLLNTQQWLFFLLGFLGWTVSIIYTLKCKLRER